MEATGVYHLRLAYALNKIGVFVSVVNPLSVKNFSRAVMCRTKTDKEMQDNLSIMPVEWS